MDIKYNFPQLDAAADHCGSAVRNLTAELDNLEKNVSNLIGTWSGTAKDAYIARQKEWDNAADGLKVLLTGIEQALRESSAKMKAREAANKAKFE